MSQDGEKRPAILEIHAEEGLAIIRLGEEVHELRLDDALVKQLRMSVADRKGHKGEAETSKGNSGAYPDRSTA